MRKKIVAGNWKMNTTPQEGSNLTMKIIEQMVDVPSNVQLIVAPPFTHLSSTIERAKGSLLMVSSQNCAEWDKGAYTGEVSASMLSSLGVKYCILGHSERREYFKETSATLLQKVYQALNNAISPIFCCGEVLEQRDANNHFQVVQSQIEEVLFQLSAEQIGQVVIAYEPVWAIGTGRTATPEQAQEMHAHIRQVLSQKFGKLVAYNTSILYGGSCKPDNAKEIFAKPDVDGGLIGGASLKADDFVAIAKSFPG